MARAPEVVDDLTAAGMSSLLWGLACIRYYDDLLMDLLCRKIAESCHTYTVRVRPSFCSIARQVVLRSRWGKARRCYGPTVLQMAS